MPWTNENPPRPAKNWPDDAKARCVRAANAVLGSTGDERQAILACIRASGMSKIEAKNVQDGKIVYAYVNDELVSYAMKTEDGKDYPAGDFAYVPNKEKPSTWKLRLTSTPGGEPDSRIVGAAVAALGKGFRGQKVQIPSGDVASVKAKVRAAWKKIHPDDEVPDALMTEEELAKEYELKEIRDVEIFRVGTWNGDKYTPEDLDEMVANFDRVGFRPPVKLGHREVSGGEAYGWVKALRRQGDRLVADFMDLPEKVHEKIKERAFDTVSSEIFWNLARNGAKFKRVLKAVALLGSETPAVSGLKPLRESFTSDELSLVHTYTFDEEDFQMADTKQLEEMQAKLKEADDKYAALQAELEKLKKKGGGDDLALQLKDMKDRQEEMAKQLAEAKERERQAVVHAKLDKLRVPAFKDHITALYEFVSAEPAKTVKFSTIDDKGDKVVRDTPFVSVLDDLVKRINKTSEYLYHEHSKVGEWSRDDVPGTASPGEEIDALVKRHMGKHGVGYQEALKVVLDDPDNAELKKSYALRQ